MCIFKAQDDTKAVFCCSFHKPWHWFWKELCFYFHTILTRCVNDVCQFKFHNFSGSNSTRISINHESAQSCVEAFGTDSNEYVWRSQKEKPKKTALTLPSPAIKHWAGLIQANWRQKCSREPATQTEGARSQTSWEFGHHLGVHFLHVSIILYLHFRPSRRAIMHQAVAKCAAGKTKAHFLISQSKSVFLLLILILIN